MHRTLSPLEKVLSGLLALFALAFFASPHGYPPSSHAGDAGPEALTMRFIGFNVAAPGVSTNIITQDAQGNSITTGLTPRSKSGFWRITIVLATDSVVDETVTDGTTTFTSSLNAGVALTHGLKYSFDSPFAGVIPATQTQTSSPKPLAYNWQVETNGVIRELFVQESDTGG